MVFTNCVWLVSLLITQILHLSGQEYYPVTSESHTYTSEPNQANFSEVPAQFTEKSLSKSPPIPTHLSEPEIPKSPPVPTHLPEWKIPKSPPVPTHLPEWKIPKSPPVPTHLPEWKIPKSPPVPTHLPEDKIPKSPPVPTLLPQRKIPKSPSLPAHLPEQKIPSILSVPAHLLQWKVSKSPEVPELYLKKGIHIFHATPGPQLLESILISTQKQDWNVQNSKNATRYSDWDYFKPSQKSAFRIEQTVLKSPPIVTSYPKWNFPEAPSTPTSLLEQNMYKSSVLTEQEDNSFKTETPSFQEWTSHPSNTSQKIHPPYDTPNSPPMSRQTPTFFLPKSPSPVPASPPALLEQRRKSKEISAMLYHPGSKDYHLNNNKATQPASPPVPALLKKLRNIPHDTPVCHSEIKDDIQYIPPTRNVPSESLQYDTQIQNKDSPDYLSQENPVITPNQSTSTISLGLDELSDDLPVTEDVTGMLSQMSLGVKK